MFIYSSPFYPPNLCVDKKGLIDRVRVFQYSVSKLQGLLSGKCAKSVS